MNPVGKLMIIIKTSFQFSRVLFRSNFKAKLLIEQWRFPHLAERIFDQVDDQSLNNCKEISDEVLEYLENERFFWIRIIKKYIGKLKVCSSNFTDLLKRTSIKKLINMNLKGCFSISNPGAYLGLLNCWC